MVVLEHHNYEKNTRSMILECTMEDLLDDPTFFHDVYMYAVKRAALAKAIDEAITQGTSTIQNPAGLLAGTSEPDFTFEEPDGKQI